MGDGGVLASWIELEGCFNFRDLGGYLTHEGRRFRKGLVFRADGLQHLTPTDLEKLRAEIGLGTVIDLRSNVEVEEAGRGEIAQQTTIHSIPLFPEARPEEVGGNSDFQMPSNMGELYFLMLVAARKPIAEVVKLLCDAKEPAVFHCAAGKDRTGVISALLLSLIGVPDETIILDYAFSRRNIDQINARLDSSETYQRLMNDLPEGAYDADPECMKTFLEKIRDKYGSAEGWADQAGIDLAAREKLKQRLLH